MPTSRITRIIHLKVVVRDKYKRPKVYLFRGTITIMHGYLSGMAYLVATSDYRVHQIKMSDIYSMESKYQAFPDDYYKIDY